MWFDGRRNSRRGDRLNRATEHLAVAECASSAQHGKTSYRHHQVSHAARAGSFPWVFLLGSEGWMIDGKRSVVIAVFTKLALLLTCIQIGWQLGAGGCPGRSRWPSEAVSLRKRLSAEVLSPQGSA